jgi:murein DD-endopeptidase MepM/ murein hydrolase activator NlpD
LAIEKKKQEDRERALALAKREQEEKERLALVEKQKREELERKLALEKKEREEKERVLLAEKQKREEEERKAAQSAEPKSRRDRILAREREEQEERLTRLKKEREEQESRQQKLAEQRRLSEAQQRLLVAQKQKQEEEQRKLIEDKKERERELARAAQSNTYYNPRYIPDLAGKEKPMAINNSGSGSTSSGAGTKAFEKDDYKFSLTPKEREIANNFEQSRGSLPWPVEKGFIVEHFGKNKHPVFNIVTDNYGIDIKTSRGAKARAIFTGEVASIISIPGTAWQTVVINHGSYFTVYAKLEKVFVAKGAKVTTKQPIGVVITDEEGNTQINFQVWKVGANGSSVKVNPELWIAQ